MKQILKGNSVSCRVIAFVMAIVMLFTLVAVDSGFHLFAAEDEAEKTIDITDLLNGDDTEMVVGYNEQESFKIIYEEKEVDESKIDLSKAVYKVYTDAAEIEEEVASSTDAPAVLDDISSIISKIYNVSKENNYCVIVIYMPNEDYTIYKEKYSVKVVYDADEPEVNNVTVNGNVIKNEEDGYYILNKGKKTDITFSVTDGTADNASDIDSVTCKKADTEIPCTLNDDGTYTISNITGSGTYTITAADKAGNTSDTQTVVIKEASGISIQRVTTDENNKTTEYTKDSVTIIGTQNSIAVKVQASEYAGAGTDFPMTLTLHYSFTDTDYSNDKSSEITVNSEVAFSNGCATVNIPTQLSENAKDLNGTLVMWITDEFGNKTYAFDENGYLVFVDSTPPDLDIKNIFIEKGDSKSNEYSNLAGYNEASDADKWGRSFTAQISSKDEQSYLTQISSVKDSGNVETLWGVVNEYEASVDFTEAENLPDGVYDFKITSRNYVGLENNASFNVYIDTTAPALKIASEKFSSKTIGYDSEDSVEQYIAPTDEVIQISAVDSPAGGADECSGVKSITVTENGKPVKTEKTEKTEKTANRESCNVAAKSLGKGTHTLKITATDNAGNSTVQYVKIKIVDTTVTSGITVKAGGSAVSGSDIFYTNKNQVTVKYSAEGYLLKNTTLKVNDTEQSCSLSKKENSDGSKKNTYSITYTFESQGNYTFVYTTKQDGVSTPTVRTYTIVYDTDAPTLGGISFSNAAYKDDSMSYYGYTGSGSAKPIAVVTVASDKLSPIVSYKATNNNKTVKEENITAEKQSNEIRKLTIEIPWDKVTHTEDKNSDNTYTVSFTDKAGNTSKVSATFCVDRSAPSVSSVKLTNEVTDLSGDKSEVYCSSTDGASIDIAAKDSKYIKKLQIEGQYISPKGKTETLETKDIYSASKDLKSEIAKTYVENRKKDGKYVLYISAEDEVGNQSDAKEISFVLDTTKPDISEKAEKGSKAVAESTFMSQQKTITLSVTDDYLVDMDIDDITASIKYKYWDSDGEEEINLSDKVVYDEENNEFVIKVDLKQRKGKPTIYYGLTVAAEDGAGNTRTKKFKGVYYIDKTKPNISLKSVKYAGGKAVRTTAYNDGYYNSNVDVSLMFAEQFQCIGNLTHSYRIINTADDNRQLASGQFIRKDNNKGDILCKTQGKYKLKIIADDAVGNERVMSLGTFYIDRTAPTIEITNRASVNNTVNSSDVTVNYKLSDNLRGGTYTISVVRKDAAGNDHVSTPVDRVSWTSGAELENAITFSEEGDYTVTISAVDKAKNKSAENDAYTVRFRIDKTAPVISITGVNDQQTSGCTATISIAEAFAWTYNESNQHSQVTVNVTKKTDSTSETSYVTHSLGNFSAANPHTDTISFTEDGEYTITVDATDSTGNKAAQAAKTFKIDSAAPEITVEAVDKNKQAVKNYNTIGGRNTDDKNFVSMSINVKEEFFNTDNVDIKVTKDDKDVSASYFTDYKNNGLVSTGTQKFTDDGVYGISVTAEDALGNKAESYSLTFIVDNTSPVLASTGVLDDFKARDVVNENGVVLLNAGDFADILEKGVDALWTISDTSTTTVDAKLDGADLINFENLSEGYHKITLEVTDAVGHTSSDEFEFVYDGIAPRIIISGVEDDGKMKEPFTLTISLEDPEDTITSIKINDKDIAASEYENNVYTMNVEEYGVYDIEVMAEDKAGNPAYTYELDDDGNIIKSSVFSFTLSQGISMVAIIIIAVACIIVIALIIFIILAGRRKKDRREA